MAAMARPIINTNQNIRDMSNFNMSNFGSLMKAQDTNISDAKNQNIKMTVLLKHEKQLETQIHKDNQIQTKEAMKVKNDIEKSQVYKKQIASEAHKSRLAVKYAKDNLKKRTHQKKKARDDKVVKRFEKSKKFDDSLKILKNQARQSHQLGEEKLGNAIVSNEKRGQLQDKIKGDVENRGNQAGPNVSGVGLIQLAKPV